MDDTRLSDWALATFHTTIFVTIALTILYIGGGLGDLLASLNTLLGLAGFGIFWLLTWWTTRQAVQRISWAGVDDPIPFGRIVAYSAQWGGISGALILLAILVVVVAFLLVTDPVELVSDAWFLALAAMVASLVAFIVGAVVGVLFALVDSALLVIVRYVYNRYRSP